MANEIRVIMTGQDDLSDVAKTATKKASRSVEELADSAQESGKRMKRDLTGSFDALGEGAGSAEGKFIGLSDTISGTSSVMEGLRTGNVQELAMGLADLAGATEALWASFGKVITTTWAKVTATAADTTATVTNTISTAAHRVATIASEAATKAWAAAQWLLNAALSANPIGLVVIGIVALVAALVLAWQHSETFRNIVTGAFEAVLAAGKTVWEWIQKAWPVLLHVLTYPYVQAWNVINAVWDGIKSGVTATKNWVVDTFNEIVATLTSLPGRVGSAVMGLWDGLQNSFRDAVNWIIGKWNNLSFGIPSIDTKIPGIGTVGGFNVGTWPKIPYLAKGGITNGPTLAMIGDNPGGREAVVPLPANGLLGGSTTVNVYALDPKAAGEAVVRALREAKRAGLTGLVA